MEDPGEIRVLVSPDDDKVAIIKTRLAIPGTTYARPEEVLNTTTSMYSTVVRNAAGEDSARLKKVKIASDLKPDIIQSLVEHEAFAGGICLY